MISNVAKRKTFTIFTQRLAGYLMFRGFVLVSVGRSEVDPTRNVFHFFDSNELREAIDEYKQVYGKIRN